MANRPCSSATGTHCPPPNPEVFPSSALDSPLDVFLGVPNPSALAIDLSLDHLLDSRDSDADRNDLIDRALGIGTLLLEAGKRFDRKLASSHNSAVWPLPYHLTSRVFSLLDMESLCYAATACSMFNKCAMDPLCYANIDLTTTVPTVTDVVVSTMIHRAGKVLRSLKLGIIPGSSISSSYSQPSVPTFSSLSDESDCRGKESSILTWNCLLPLSEGSAASGALLRSLHLYNIERLDHTCLCVALKACPSLIDLEIVGIHVKLKRTLMSISTNCHLIERLVFESSKTGRGDTLNSSVCGNLVSSCPNLTTLALRGSMLTDNKARILAKGFRKLKCVDFSTSCYINGSFLRNLDSSSLEILILRGCGHLKEVEVAGLFAAILAGDFKLLRHLDISNRQGLASEGGRCRRCIDLSVINLKQVLDARPDMRVVAEFSSEESDIISSYLSDSPSPMSSPESSYSSDQDSVGQHSGLYGDSSEETDDSSVWDSDGYSNRWDSGNEDDQHSGLDGDGGNEGGAHSGLDGDSSDEADYSSDQDSGDEDGQHSGLDGDSGNEGGPHSGLDGDSSDEADCSSDQDSGNEDGQHSGLDGDSGNEGGPHSGLDGDSSDEMDYSSDQDSSGNEDGQHSGLDGDRSDEALHW